MEPRGNLPEPHQIRRHVCGSAALTRPFRPPWASTRSDWHRQSSNLSPEPAVPATASRDNWRQSREEPTESICGGAFCSIPSSASPETSRLIHDTTMGLDGRALDRAVGAENAAIAGRWTQQRFAVPAFVKNLAGIRGHGFLRGRTAMRAGQRRLKDNRQPRPDSRFHRCVRLGGRPESVVAIFLKNAHRGTSSGHRFTGR